LPGSLVALDIDNCLMPVDEPAAPETREGLQGLAETGARVCFASGKPCLYLSGLARGLGVVGASLIGENGADIWVASTMPPVRLPVAVRNDERDALARLRAEVLERYGNQVFFQPNSVGVTAFPLPGGPTPDAIARAVGVDMPPSIVRYVHVDSVDWAIGRVDKGAALRRLAEHLRIPLTRVAAVGDSANDLPMFSVAALSLWVGDPEAVRTCEAQQLPSIAEALARVQEFASAV